MFSADSIHNTSNNEYYTFTKFPINGNIGFCYLFDTVCVFVYVSQSSSRELMSQIYKKVKIINRPILLSKYHTKIYNMRTGLFYFQYFGSMHSKIPNE